MGGNIYIHPISASWKDYQMSDSIKKTADLRKQERDIKFAIAEIYLMLKKVEVYQELNHTGIEPEIETEID